VLKLASSGEGTCYKRLIEISLMTTDGYGKLWYRAGPSQLAVPFGDRVQFRPAKWQEISLNDCSRIFLPFQRLAETRCLGHWGSPLSAWFKGRAGPQRDIFQGSGGSGPN
jgi:hypothetical protein